MMRNSGIAIFVVGGALFGVLATDGVGQVLKDLPIERTVKRQTTTYGFDATAGSMVVSKNDESTGSSRVTSPAEISVNLPKSVGRAVLIEAKVYKLDSLPSTGPIGYSAVSDALAQVAAGQHKLIATPSIVGSLGNRTSFQSVVNVTLAKAFAPPTIPKSYEGVVTGGLTVGKKAMLRTNDGEVILPPHPTEFENRNIGLTLNFLPKLEKDGSVSVACDVEHTTLGPFEDQGTRIVRETKKLIGKKTKTDVLLENNQFLPTYLTQKTSFTAKEKLGTSASKLMAAVPSGRKFVSPSGNAPQASFTEIIVRDQLPPLLVSVSAKKIDVAKPKAKAVIHKDAQIFLTLRAVEISDELGVISGVPDIDLGILTDPQFQVLIRGLKSQKGVDLLTAPSIMMRGDQAGKIEVVREFIYPTKYGAPELPEPEFPAEKGKALQSFPVTPAVPLEFATTNTGIEFGVVARAVDGHSIELQLKPEVTKFKGFLNFGEPILTHDYQRAFGKPVSVVMTENRIEMPVFDKRRLETTVRIPDGGTVCIGGFVTNNVQDLQDKVPLLGDMPLVGRAFRKDVELHTQRRLYFFVRAELMDPAGTPITKK